MNEKLASQILFDSLDTQSKETIERLIEKFHLSFQDTKQIVDIALDLQRWNEGVLQDFIAEIMQNATHKKIAMKALGEKYKLLQTQIHSYENFQKLPKNKSQKLQFQSIAKEDLGLGLCPVASPKTRCCNLLTLDAVESCGFDCSYCSIQSFYTNGQVTFDSEFKNKLQNLQLDPQKTYHIGTGQSSDSLIWGNKEGVLEALFEFAKSHPNVILELKTKSKNIDYLLKNEIPRNILVTWSLNAPTIITYEEHLSASLDERLECAKKIQEKGNLVGFHFHPMVFFDKWKEEYGKVFETLKTEFDPKNVAMVSLGTLTFIKPVLKQIRKRDFYTKIHQMPLVDSDGKLSYPKEIKLQMFQFAYKSLQEWSKKVFFYMCMENHSLWMDVFGYEYSSNEDLELAMKSAYMSKIQMLQDVSLS